MLKDFSLQSLFMGALVAFVGCSSTFAVVLHGLTSVGATPTQAATGLMAVSISMGLCGVVLSVWKKMPISVAWSTPGAAVLVTAGVQEGGFAVAVGGFVICGLLIIASGLFKPLSRAVSAIPAPLANAMLAGVLVGLCFAPVKAIASTRFSACPLCWPSFWWVPSSGSMLCGSPDCLCAGGCLRGGTCSHDNECPAAIDATS